MEKPCCHHRLVQAGRNTISPPANTWAVSGRLFGNKEIIKRSYAV
jgi:IMP cyclohydrolase